MNQNDNKSHDAKKEITPISEIISPIFGHDYKNRVVARRTNQDNFKTKNSNYLEQHIAEEVAAFSHQESLSNYETSPKNDDDILTNYHKQKLISENQAALPSHYFAFQEQHSKTINFTKNQNPTETIKASNESEEYDG